MTFDEWYRQSPTRLCGPTAEDIERGRELREASLKALTEAQHPTPADMAKEITAQVKR
jgi:hypothetical protein